MDPIHEVSSAMDGCDVRSIFFPHKVKNHAHHHQQNQEHIQRIQLQLTES